MSNKIAIVWDFDKTLIDGYMQEPIFKEYGIDPVKFWKEVNSLPEKYMEEQSVKVNPETIYLNHFINYVKQGKMEGLNNEKLRELGKKLIFYKGIPEIFQEIDDMIRNEQKYKEYNIEVEHYIVSTGFKEMIEGSKIRKYITDIWGCELIEGLDKSGEKIISEIAYTIDNTSKTRALFEINKGTNFRKEIQVNSTIPEEKRRVQFKNMIYIADGPSDVPAFSVVNKNGGATFAVYRGGDIKSFRQAEKLREDGRVNMYAMANYSKNTTAYMWVTTKIKEFADRIREEERSKIIPSPPPKHIISK